MKMNASLLIGLLAFASPAFSAPMTVPLKDAKGADVGQVTLTEMANGVRINVAVKGLTPGEKAMHFHEKGVCTGPKFESAGGHFAPGHKKHGFDSAGGFHAGDMPNIIVGADGAATLEMVNTQVTLGKGENSLLKTGGTALVIHAKADDYKSQPSGDAGDRLACGEIKALVSK